MAIHKIVNPAVGTVAYRVDIKPSRKARRIRKTFTRIADAKAFETKYRSEYQQVTHLNKDTRPDILISTLIDGYYNSYVTLHIKDPERGEQSRLNLFKHYFENRTLHSITYTDGELFMAQRLASGVKAGTINRDLNVLRSFFKWIVRNRYLQNSPFKDLQKIKTDEVRPRWLNGNEIESILAACYQLDDPDLATVIKVALNTGFRKANIINLRPSDIGDTFITAQKTKSGKPYQVPISNALRGILFGLKSHDGQETILNTAGLRERYERACKQAGLWKDKNDPQKVTFHTLRHTFAAQALKAGVDIYTVSHWLGHASIAITQKHYGHLAESHHTDQIKKFPGLG